MSFKPYKIDFKFTVNDSASMYLVAETPEAAAAGALLMLQEDASRYADPEIINVEEFKKPTETAQVLN